MRIGLLTEGGYPYAHGEAGLWCDRLVRGLPEQEFEVYALSRSARQETGGRVELPRQVRRVRTARLWGPALEPRPAGGAAGRRWRRRFAEHYGRLAAAVCAPSGAEDGAESGSAHQKDRFAEGLHGLAELARDHTGLPAALRSEAAVRLLERACRAPGALAGAQAAQPADLLAVAEAWERALRPLSLDWYADGAGGLGTLDLCHATSAGVGALPGLLAQRLHGVPLLVTEYGVRLREHYLTHSADALSGPVRALLASFQGRLATEVYARAALVTAGNTHVRRWQERCGAARTRVRTVYPGMDARAFAGVGEQADGTGAAGGGRTLVWVGHVEPAKDLVGLLHAFAEIRRSEPEARLLVVETAGGGSAGHDSASAGYAAHCRALAAQLFPDEAANAVTAGENPVAFEEIGAPGLPGRADAYAAGDVVVLSSAVEGFPVGLIEAMFAGRATVSTDVGAVCEVIGGTGLVVPSRNPRALADACVALLRDPERQARLGAAARARALELFTVDQNIAAFRGIYLELMSHCPVERGPAVADGAPLPFGRPAESRVPGNWAARPARSPARRSPVAPRPRTADAVAPGPSTAEGRAPDGPIRAGRSGPESARVPVGATTPTAPPARAAGRNAPVGAAAPGGEVDA